MTLCLKFYIRFTNAPLGFTDSKLSNILAKFCVVPNALYKSSAPVCNASNANSAIDSIS